MLEAASQQSQPLRLTVVKLFVKDWTRFIGSDRHGQRISNVLTCEDLCEEVVVPTGDLHFASEAFFQGMVLESRDGEAS